MLDVRVGDLVLTHRERWRPVTGLLVKPAPPGEKEVLFDLPGAVVGCTEDHLWYSPQGWVSARDIDTLLYPMYNHLIEEVEHGDKDLCPVRFTLVESEQATPVQVLSVGMCLREAQGLQGRELPSVCNEEKCHTPVEYGRGQGQEIAGSPQGRDREANAIRGLGQAEMAAKSRRTLLQQVLGWAVYPLGLSVSMGLGNGKRSNSQRPCDTPQESGCDRRQIGEFRASAEARSFQTSRGGGAQEKRGRLTDLDMSVLRQGVSPIPTREEWRPKVLLGRTLPRGTAVYDLMVEDDHSFIIEGLVAHNTNCNCNWDIRSAVAEEGRMRWTCYWRLGFVKTEHCADCIDRALSWAPLILEA